MNLSGLLQLGFASKSLLAGADAQQQDCRWLASKQQDAFTDDLRKLADGLAKIDGDGNLTAAGKTARRRELGTAFLAQMESEGGKRLLSMAVTKRDLAHAALRKAQQPAGQTDIDRLIALMEVQNAQRFLLELKPSQLLSELMKSVEGRDAVTYKAIVGLPEFILRDRQITPEVLSAAEKEWLSKTCPSEAAAVQAADVGLQVAEGDREQVAKIVRAECKIEEPRRVEVRK